MSEERLPRSSSLGVLPKIEKRELSLDAAADLPEVERAEVQRKVTNHMQNVEVKIGQGARRSG